MGVSTTSGPNYGKYVSLVLFSSFLIVTSSQKLAKTTGPPAFFLQDNDGLCLAGGEFKRCAIDTLWYVTGKPGHHQVHHRQVEETDDELCLDRKNCNANAKDSDVRLSACSHCGAKNWNILGDSENGYVLSEGNGKFCLQREQPNDKANKESINLPKKVKLVPCEKGYTPMQLQFASRDDIKAMSSDGARLITAASDGDKRKVKEFLNKDKVDVNARDWDQLTALIGAASSGHLDVVKYLVDQGANVNAKDKDDITALMEASIMGHTNIVKYLISKKATVDLPAASGVTALWLAASEGKDDIVSLLIGAGADVNNARSDGITALMAASVGSHFKTAKLLLDKGADAKVTDDEGLTALINASEMGSDQIVNLLLEKYEGDANDMSTSGFTPLIVASANGHLKVVKQLIKYNAEVNAVHPEGVNALMYAAAGGHIEVVEYLIQNGADINKLHAHGGSALMEACTSGNIAVVEVLVKNGADVTVTDKDGVTTLMSAAAQGHIETTKLLLESKATDVNSIASSGGTALMFAAAGGHTEVCKLLLDAGANVNMAVVATEEYKEQMAAALQAQEEEGNNDGNNQIEKPKDGVTALHIASLRGYLETVELLVNEGKADVLAVDEESFSALKNAVQGNHGEVATFLIENGANPNDVYVDDEGREHNLLMDALIVENEKFAQLLISHKANVDYIDQHGVTTLIQAAHKGLKEVVIALLELNNGNDGRQIDVEASTEENVTALIAAAAEGHTEIVTALLAIGKANVNAVDKDGTDALMGAAVRGHKDVVEILLANGANVNAQNNDGHTALMFAYNGKTQVASLRDKYSEYMLNAEMETANEEGETQEMSQKEKEEHEYSTKIIQDALNTHIEVIEMLKKKGADVNLKDNEGHTALDFDYTKPESVASPNDQESNENDARQEL